VYVPDVVGEYLLTSVSSIAELYENVENSRRRVLQENKDLIGY
jgi:hypothetical protein